MKSSGSFIVIYVCFKNFLMNYQIYILLLLLLLLLLLELCSKIVFLFFLVEINCK